MPIARAGEINIEYHLEGSGPPLLMMMGLGGQASSWGEPFLEGLRKHFRVIRFSNRGTGLSDKPDVQPTIPMMADDAAGLLREIGVEGTHVLGVSMGGMIAQEMALNHSERVQGLVLGCTNCGAAHSLVASQEVISMLMPQPGLSREEQVRKTWPAVTTPAFLESHREFLEEMLRIGLENPTPVETLMRQVVAVQAFDTYDRLPEIAAPTLIIHGAADALVPLENAKILAQRIAKAELRVIPGAAHVFFWEFPQESARAIVEFLTRVPAAIKQ